MRRAVATAVAACAAEPGRQRGSYRGGWAGPATAHIAKTKKTVLLTPCRSYVVGSAHLPVPTRGPSVHAPNTPPPRRHARDARLAMRPIRQKARPP